MNAKRCTIIILLLLCSSTLADTFTNIKTNESFNGYPSNIVRGNKVLVRTEKGRSRYIDPAEYKIVPNYDGRRDKIYVFQITDTVELKAEAEAFAKALSSAANQGPRFIMIKLDTPGGRIDLAKEMCSAIIKTTHCPTVAYINGGKNGGAYSAGVTIAMACDKIYIKTGTAMGAASTYVETVIGPEPVESIYGRAVAEKINSTWLAFCAAVAQKNGRPALLAKAMVDKDLEVVEIERDGQRLFIDRSIADTNTPVKNVWSKKGSLLTLTAEGAVATGMADAAIAAESELLADFGCEKTRRILDKSIAKARLEYEKAEKKLNKILPDIEMLEARIKTLTEDIGMVERDLRTISRLSLRQRAWGMWGDANFEWQMILAEYEAVCNEFLFNLENLGRGYNAGILIAKRHSDMEMYKTKFEDGIEAAQAKRMEIITRLRSLYW